MKSEVLLIKDEFALVQLRGHTKGRLAYVPVRQVCSLLSSGTFILVPSCVTMFLAQIYNDVFGKRDFVIGQVNQVMIKRVGSSVRAVLAMYEKEKAKVKGKKGTENESESPVQLGELVAGT